MTRDAALVGRLHVLTDEVLQGRFTHVELALLAARGGADTIQFREKRPRGTAELVRVAASAREAARTYGARLLVDDRADIALASDADGVHLGREDLAPAIARGMLGRGRLVGATLNSLDEARRLSALPVDYFGVGPIFGTVSKRDPAPALGIEGLRAIARIIRVPLIAIGGITPDRVAEVLAAGAHGVAVLSAVVCQEDPAAHAARFRVALDRALEARDDESNLARAR